MPQLARFAIRAFNTIPIYTLLLLLSVVAIAYQNPIRSFCVGLCEIYRTGLLLQIWSLHNFILPTFYDFQYVLLLQSIMNVVFLQGYF
jgi:hypothetical protein